MEYGYDGECLHSGEHVLTERGDYKCWDCGAGQPVLEIEHVEGPWEMICGMPYPVEIPVCVLCDSADVLWLDIDSYGGTTEHYEQCNSCGARYGHTDLSAVV